jgi:hypothetical protein
MLTVYTGTTVRSTVTFTDATGKVTDPSAVTLTYGVKGRSTVVHYGIGATIVRVSTGVYQCTILTSGPQRVCTVQWKGIGSCAAVGVEAFNIVPPPF